MKIRTTQLCLALSVEERNSAVMITVVLATPSCLRS
jgi:hypothetical protein